MIGAKRIYAVNDQASQAPLEFDHQISPQPERSKTMKATPLLRA
jgi:hypothetical protein